MDGNRKAGSVNSKYSKPITNKVKEWPTYRNILVYMWLLGVISISVIFTLQLMTVFDLKKELAQLPIYSHNNYSHNKITEDVKASSISGRNGDSELSKINNTKFDLSEKNTIKILRDVAVRNVASALAEREIEFDSIEKLELELELERSVLDQTHKKENINSTKYHIKEIGKKIENKNII